MINNLYICASFHCHIHYTAVSGHLSHLLHCNQSKQDNLGLHVNYLPCIWCKRCCSVCSCTAVTWPLPSIQDLKGNTQNLQCFPPLSPSLSQCDICNAVTDEERWSHLWRGSVQHCIAPRPHPTTQERPHHTHLQTAADESLPIFEPVVLQCRFGADWHGSLLYSSLSSFAVFCQALVSSVLGAGMLSAQWLMLNEDIICRVALKAVKCIKVTMSYC